MSSKNIETLYAKNHLHFHSCARKLVINTQLIVLLIIGSGFILKAEASEIAAISRTNTQAVINKDTLDKKTPKKDNVSKPAEANFPGDGSIGMTSPMLDKKQHPVAKAGSNNATPFDEAMVMAYTSKKNTTNAADAHPQTGWDSFKKYIQDKAVAADGKNGTVQLSFIVNTDGKLSDFKIINSLDNTANKAAIDLVKNGPTWVPASDGTVKEVTVKVDFH